MDKASQRSLIAVLIVLLIAAGLAAAASQGGVTVLGIPVFVICTALAFVIQWVAFVPSYLKQTEKFYDITGSITYLTVTLTAVFLSAAFDLRSLLLLALISVWTIRLGAFLFTRIQAAGEDRRFREIKPSFGRFLLAWTLQGLWVIFSLAAALVAITSTSTIGLDIFAIVGTLVWIAGFAVEVVADRQKSAFRADPGNKDRFINTGLWAWSRHPNYFGEIVLWVGVAIIALPLLQGWGWLTLISPLFIYILLTRISGVPMLEKRADEKWGGQTDYETYKAHTPVLFPRPPAASPQAD